MNVLVLNCGSSSIGFALVDTVAGLEVAAGTAQRLGSGQASLALDHGGRHHAVPLHGADPEAAIREIVDLLGELGIAANVQAVGHRVIHGGAKFSSSTLVTAEVIAKIEECIPLGPLHNPANLLGIRVAQGLFPAIPHVAVFDTAFHQTMPPRAYLYAVPYDWFVHHEVRRYGFHGTSHRYVSSRAIQQLGLDPDDHAIVTAHLGNGCSLAAVRNGQSVDTTMGLTPVDGVVMGTRSGSIDPSIVTHMTKALGCSAEEVLDALNTRSGLLGMSGLSSDMRTLQLAAQRGHARAALAVETFCHAAAKAAASMIVSLGRVDALVFTGGIGENAAEVRARIVELLAFAGFALDERANARHGEAVRGRITRSTSPMAAVVATREEHVIAMEAAGVAHHARPVAPGWVATAPEHAAGM